MNTLKWSRENIEKLILLVQEHTCIYNVKSAEYVDRKKKAMAFDSITENVKEKIPGLTVEEVKVKWTNLRSQYMRELRQQQSSKKSGSGLDDIYTPKLWCFEQLKFLESHTQTRKSTDNVEKENTSAAINVENGNEVPIPKRPKKVDKYSEVSQKFASLRELVVKKKNERKYSWLGSLIVERMEDVPQDKQDQAAWELQSVFHKYAADSRPQTSSGSTTSSTPLIRLSETSSGSTTSSKDLLQLAMDGVFDDDDFD